MKAYYCDHFVLPLPPEHRFPMRKYSRLREMILEHRIVAPDDLCVPDAAPDDQILRCHDLDYLDNVKHGRLTAAEIRRIGFPWSPEMVERSRRSVGGTIAACISAIADGTSVNLAGGTHHACRDHGEGFCVFNDVTIAARDMQVRDIAERVIVIDCDVHQGNGTAQITAEDPSIFTFSIHGENNFPFRKIDSDLDIGLPDGIIDSQYLDLVEEGTRRALFLSGADLAIYISGADPYEGDRLGKLMISKRGLAQRDELVLNIARQAGLPVAVVMGGGYAHNVEDIAAIHLETVRIASLMVSA